MAIWPSARTGPCSSSPDPTEPLAPSSGVGGSRLPPPHPPWSALTGGAFVCSCGPAKVACPAHHPLGRTEGGLDRTQSLSLGDCLSGVNIGPPSRPAGDRAR